MMYDGTITIPDPGLVETITEGLPEGFVAYVQYDNDPGDSPREWAGNVATLINENSRTIDIDDDDAGLAEIRRAFRPYDTRPAGRGSTVDLHYFYFVKRQAESRHNADDMVNRYLRIYRPDVLAYVGHWSAGESYGWGYVTRDAWTEAVGEESASRLNPHLSKLSARSMFNSEVEEYRQWAEGEVYGVTVANVKTGEEASVWGIYDGSSDWQYIKECVIPDLIEEVSNV